MLLRVLAVAGALVIAGVAFLLLRSDTAEQAGPALRATTNVDLQPGELSVETIGFPTEFPVEVRDQVLSTLGAYVDDAVVNPLRRGAADDAALATVFDLAALARATGTDRALLLDEDLPKAVGEIDITTPPVSMTALADAQSTLVLVAGNIDLSVSAQTRKGRLEIKRAGSFVFAPDETGAWKITGWTISTERGGKSLGTSATSTAPTAVTP